MGVKPKRRKFTIKIDCHGEYLKTSEEQDKQLTPVLQAVEEFFRKEIKDLDPSKTVMQALQHKLNEGDIPLFIKASGIRDNQISFLSDDQEADDLAGDW